MSLLQRSFVLLTGVLVVLATLFFSSPSITRAAGVPPKIVYTQTGPRSLIFVNNPELLIKKGDARLAATDAGDFADDGRAIYTQTLQNGSYRDFFEHINFNPKGKAGYGVRLFNGSTTSITATIEKSGFSLDTHDTGHTYAGQVFTNLFNSTPSTVQQTVAPGKTLWLLQEDTFHDTANGGATPKGIPYGLFTGVVDFTIAGATTNVSVSNLIYTAPEVGPILVPEPRFLTYEGYVTRLNSPLSSGRFYKGMAQGVSQVAASRVNYVLSKELVGSDKVLQATYPLYTKASDGTYAPSATPVIQDGWLTNQGQGFVGENPKNPNKVVTSDMLAYTMPPSDNRTIDPLKPSDALNRYPNLGNWGVVYTVSGTLLNTSTDTAFAVDFKLQSPAAIATISYQTGNNGSKWKTLVLTGPNGGTPAVTQTLRTLVLPPATDSSATQVPYTISFVLGAPSNTPIQQFFEAKPI